MKDGNCVEFLQLILPQLNYRWEGFRKPRKQVCKRTIRRIKELDLEGFSEYKIFIERNPSELNLIDSFCSITISRFFRDRRIFKILRNYIFPAITKSGAGLTTISCWCAGSASGEEPYSVNIIWNGYLSSLKNRDKKNSLKIIATDYNKHMIKRAEEGCYPGGSLKEVSSGIIREAFYEEMNCLRIKDIFRKNISFRLQDIRKEMPEGKFNLIFCRYLAFTYLAKELQKNILNKLIDKLYPGGFLIIGSNENLPEDTASLKQFKDKSIYKKI